MSEDQLYAVAWLGAVAVFGLAVALARLVRRVPRPTHPVLAHGATRVELPPPAPLADEESLDVWGFADTRFRVNERGHVELTGRRYALSGHELPALLPWIRRMMELELDVRDRNPSRYPPNVPPSRASAELVAALGSVLGPERVSIDDKLRLRHGHGHTQEEMFAIKYEDAFPRVPDVVVWPTSAEEVASLVALARAHGATLIPFGGGTNVTDALRCPVREDRVIVSVDLRRMDRVRWIDPVNRVAEIEAGAVGRHIAQQLAPRGWTIGHEPDSVEFSTLGGWIATHASGMKKNRYGNIEDLLLDVHVVTAQGELARRDLAPRESVGSDPRLALLGSEGNLGIVTSAVVRIFPVPPVQRYGSILFPDFPSGVAFLYELAMSAEAPPASVRLVDNFQFQFSQTLKPARVGAKKLVGAAEKWLVTKVLGYDPNQMVACTLVFEGEEAEVRAQEAAVYACAKRHGGMAAGAENGERGYQLTFGIAYIRDFVLEHWILAESFETSVPWSRALELCEKVKQRVRDEHALRRLPGKPFITCRVTQIYPTGVCVYFYFAYYYKGVEHPTAIYAELETAARDEILRCGGSLSHHHGIGKIREPFLERIMSDETRAWRARAKAAHDPLNVFGAGNAGVVASSPAGGPATHVDRARI